MTDENQIVGRVYKGAAELNNAGRVLPEGTPLYAEPRPSLLTEQACLRVKADEVLVLKTSRALSLEEFERLANMVCGAEDVGIKMVLLPDCVEVVATSQIDPGLCEDEVRHDG